MAFELIRRASRKYKYIRSRVLYQFSKNIQTPEAHRKSEINENIFPYSAPAAKNSIIEQYKKYFTRDLEEEIRLAEENCRHGFSFLGHPYQHGKEIQWDLDPVSRKHWGMGFSPDIIYKGPQRIGDIKVPWELNKHQYFFILGKLLYIKDNKRYADEILEEIDSWIDRNPPFSGINWISSLEIGMRVISWIMVYPFIKNKVIEPFLSKYIASLICQIRYIEDNLSLSKYSNTHLTGEASTLIVGGLFLRVPESGRWLRKGMEILVKQIRELSYEDGVYKEQSLHYQRFFLDYYYFTLFLLRNNGIKYPAEILLKMEKMTEFLMYSLKPDGTAPSFGDNDDARGIFIKKKCINDYRGILGLGALLFNRSDFKYGAKEMPEEILWLSGEAGVENYQQIESTPAKESSKAFEGGGYYIMRSGWEEKANYLIFDCGPLGYGPSGHGHADALSFQLQCHGFNYLVDPGSYSYNLDYEWRDYFRSTMAHNTITVDERNQAEIGDRMSWKTSVAAKCNFRLCSRWFDIVEGQHDGYQRLKDPVLHRRIIFFDRSDCWIILDFLECCGPHTFDFYFHLHPDCSVKIDCSKRRFDLCSPENGKLSVKMIANGNDGATLNLLEANEQTKLGWYSENYGLKKPGKAIRIRKENQGSTAFITCIKTSRKDFNVKCEHNGLYALLSITDPREEREDTLFYSLDGPQIFTTPSLRFSGRFLFTRKLSNNLSVICGKDFTSLEYKDMNISSRSQIESAFVADNNCEVNMFARNIDQLKLFGNSINKVEINGREFKSLGGKVS